MSRRLDRHNTTWTEQEKEMLCDLWGSLTPDTIARKMGRTDYAVIQAAKDMKLGSYLENSDYLRLCQVAKLMGVSHRTIGRTWIPKYNMPFVKRRIRGDYVHRVIHYDNLMKWLKENTQVWDSRTVAPYALGTEPPWLIQKRAEDRKKNEKPAGTKYTAVEDMAIRLGRRAGKTYRQIGAEIGRSRASVMARAERMRY